MKRTVLAVTITALVAGGIGTAAANPGKGPGNGAQKAGITGTSGFSLLDTCAPADSAKAGKQTATGFAVLNAPGKPGSPKKVVGQVALKDAEPGTYDLRLHSPGDAACGESIGTLEVGANRQGSARVASADNAVGDYYVVLLQETTLDGEALPVIGGLLTQARYASAPVALR